MYSWLFLIVTILLTAVANIFLKYSALKSQPPAQGFLPTLIQMCSNIPLITGIGFLAVAVISYSLALKQINLSVAYPIMTTSVVVIVAFFSTLLFAEPVTLNKVIGTIIVVCGVILLSH